MAFKKILIGVDFTQVTGMLLHVGSDLAKQSGAAVRLLHTEPPTSGYVYYMPGIGYDNLVGFGLETSVDADIESVQIDHDKHALEAIQEQFVENKIPASIALLSGDPAQTIISEAKSFKADLIIIGSHRHGFFYNLMFGSVENRVLKESSIPILVVPAAKTNGE